MCLLLLLKHLPCLLALYFYRVRILFVAAASPLLLTVFLLYLLLVFFLVILLVAYIYIWRKGALEWR